MAQIIKDLITQPLAGENLVVTEAVYISDGTGADVARTAGSAYKLDITITERSTFAGFVKATVLSGVNVKIVNAGRVKGFTGLTQGKTIWAHASTPGAYTSTEPLISVPLGIAESATVIIATSQFGKQDNLSGKSIIAPEKVEAKTDTLANLTTYATTATNGEQVFASDTKEAFQVIDGVLVAIGGGGGAGSLDTFDTEDFEDTGFTVESSGNNASFLGGGTIDGTVSFETGSPISKTQSLKYTASTVSNNDYVEIKTIDLDLKQRGRDILIRLSADMSGFANDVTIVSYRKTATAKVISSTLDILEASRGRDFYEYLIPIPSDCTQISFGVHMNNGAVSTESFLIDDIEHSTRNPTIADLIDTQSARYNTLAGYGSTDTKIPYFTNEVENRGTPIVSIVNDSTNGFRLTALRECTVDISFSGNFNAAEIMAFSLNSTQLTTGVASITTADRLCYSDPTSGGNNETISVSVRLDQGDILRPHVHFAAAASTADRNHISFTAQATSEHVVTPATSNINSYSARVTNNGTASIVSQDFGGIASVVNTGTGRVTVTFTAGLFTVIPSITAIVSDSVGFGNYIIEADSASTASILIRTFNDAGTVVDVDFDITINKQGIDVKNASFLAAIPKDEFQTKILSVDNTTSADISDFQFNNLTIGKSYSISGQILTTTGTGAAFYRFRSAAANAGTLYATINHNNLAFQEQSLSATFIATSTTMYCNHAKSGSSTIHGNNTLDESYVQLTELKTTKETTKFS